MIELLLNSGESSYGESSYGESSYGALNNGQERAS